MVHRFRMLSVVATLFLAAPATAEPISALYLGFSLTADNPYTVNGDALPPSIVCLAQCSSAKSPVGGLRVGYWFERLPWLGIAGDFSAYIAGWGIESPYEVTAFPISGLVTVRGRLIPQEGFDNGRIQPYAAIGPSIVVSNATVNSGFAVLGNSRSASATAADIGLDARVGVEILTTTWFGVLFEYRYSYSKPSWTIEGDEVETTLSVNQLILGLVAHY